MDPGASADLLSIMECPFCGARLQPDEAARNEWRDGAMTYGVLHCQCCVYPVVDGIPFVHAGATASAALRLVGSGRHEQALVTLLGAADLPAERLQPLLRDEPTVTFRDALELLSRDAEGMYLLYRFSDPTYLASRALLGALGQSERCWTRRILDVGGGAGHLTRTLCARAGGRPVVLADITYWKLWLARRFIAPSCQPVCCDANVSLPFASDAFSLAFCSDAFHYVWSRRALALEMLRVTGTSGVVALAHLHNALVDNPSAGMPLDPAGYRHLFRGVPHRVIGERSLLDVALAGGVVDLFIDASDDAVGAEPALSLVATHAPDVFERYRVEGASHGVGPLALNPLYHPERRGDVDVLQRRFPSEYYEMEFSESTRYLPEAVTLDGEGADDERARFVKLELPDRYA